MTQQTSPPNPTDALIRQIKRRLFYGEPLDVISQDTGIPLPTLGNVRSGHRWAHIRWPNGANGALPETRRRQIVVARRLARRQMHVLVEKLLKESERKARRDGTGKFFPDEKPFASSQPESQQESIPNAAV